MSRPPELFVLLQSDRVFYWLVGLFTSCVFVAGIAALTIVSPDGVGSRELVGFVVGFAIFMLIYFVSMAIYRLVPE